MRLYTTKSQIESAIRTKTRIMEGYYDLLTEMTYKNEAWKLNGKIGYKPHSASDISRQEALYQKYQSDIEGLEQVLADWDD